MPVANIRYSRTTKRAAFIGAAAAVLFFFTLSTGVGEHHFYSLLPAEERTLHALEACVREFGRSIEGRRCYHDTLLSAAKADSLVAATGAYVRMVQRNGATGLMHFIAHELGDVVFGSVGGTIEQALAACPSVAHTGCQHGAVGAYLLSQGDASVSVDYAALPALCRETSETKGAYRLCMHGLGHAFFLITKGGLHESLELCEALPVGAREKSECLTGVFMESNGGLHYLPDAAARAAAAADRLYPCRSGEFDEQSRRACYLMLPSKSGWTPERGFRACREAPHEWRETCAHGVGIGVGARWPADARRVVTECLRGEELAEQCLRGALGYIAVGESAESRSEAVCTLLQDRGKYRACGSAETSALP